MCNFATQGSGQADIQTGSKKPFFCLSCDSSAQLCCHTRGTHGPSRARCSSGRKKAALRVSGPDTMEGREVVREEGREDSGRNIVEVKE